MKTLGGAGLGHLSFPMPGIPWRSIFRSAT